MGLLPTLIQMEREARCSINDGSTCLLHSSARSCECCFRRRVHRELFSANSVVDFCKKKTPLMRMLLPPATFLQNHPLFAKKSWRCVKKKASMWYLNQSKSNYGSYCTAPIGFAKEIDRILWTILFARRFSLASLFFLSDPKIAKEAT